MHSPIIKEPRCSFCHKLKSAVKVLVNAGNDKHFICDECVAKFKEELADGNKSNK